MVLISFYCNKFFSFFCFCWNIHFSDIWAFILCYPVAFRKTMCFHGKYACSLNNKASQILYISQIAWISLYVFLQQQHNAYKSSTHIITNMNTHIPKKISLRITYILNNKTNLECVLRAELYSLTTQRERKLLSMQF